MDASVDDTELIASHLVIQEASLGKLDGTPLRLIVDWIDQSDLLRLMRSGDSQLVAKLQSHITTLQYTRELMQRRTVTHQGIGLHALRVIHWLWPDIVTPALFRLTSLSIDMNDAVHEKAVLVNFKTSLPPTLTNLAFGHATFTVTAKEDLLFDLPNLSKLVVYHVRTYHIVGLHATNFVPDVDWLPAALCLSPHVIDFTYSSRTNTLFSTSLCAGACLAVLPNLEHLTCVGCHLEPEHWPPKLDTVFLLRGTFSIHNVPLPATVTSLSIMGALSDVELCSLLKQAPSTLLKLAFCLKEVFIRQAVLEEVARFTQLQSLINVPQMDVELTPPLNHANLSLLPRSITELSDAYATTVEEWRNLPPNARMVSAGIAGTAIIPSYSTGYKDLVPFMPKTLPRLLLMDSAAPCHLPMLEHVEFVVNTTLASTPFYLENLPTTLTSMNVKVRYYNGMFWLGNDPKDVARRFPCLKSLSLAVCAAPVQDIRRWLEWVPKSLESLSVTLQSRMVLSYIEMPLVLQNIAFPPNLTSLVFKCDNPLSLPNVLPSALQSISVECSSMYPADLVENIVQWPASLRRVELRGRENGPATFTLVEPWLLVLQKKVELETGGKSKLHIVK